MSVSIFKTRRFENNKKNAGDYYFLDGNTNDDDPKINTCEEERRSAKKFINKRLLKRAIKVYKRNIAEPEAYNIEKSVELGLCQYMYLEENIPPQYFCMFLKNRSILAHNEIWVAPPGDLEPRLEILKKLLKDLHG